MTRKYTFKKEGLTCWIWTPEDIAKDMIELGWTLEKTEDIITAI
jgi:hypothetical protein